MMANDGNKNATPDKIRLGGVTVTLSTPTQMIFIISVVLFLLAVIGAFVLFPLVSGNAYWLAVITCIVLFIGNVANNL